MPDIIDHEIIGDDLQAVVITFDPQESVVAEAGAMMYMEDDIEMGTSLSMTEDGAGLMGKLFKAGKRLVTGESFFITIFANGGGQRRDVAFAALRGPGVVWLQTLPFSRLADRVFAAAPQGGGKHRGEGSVLGGVFDLIGGK